MYIFMANDTTFSHSVLLKLDMESHTRLISLRNWYNSKAGSSSKNNIKVLSYLIKSFHHRLTTQLHTDFVKKYGREPSLKEHDHITYNLQLPEVKT